MTAQSWAIVVAVLVMVGLTVWYGRALAAVVVVSVAVWLRRRARHREGRP